MTTTLVYIPVTPAEAKERLARAKGEARIARKLAAGLAQYGQKDRRTAKRIAGHVADAELNDRIAAGCKQALDDAASQPTDQLPATEDELTETMECDECRSVDGVKQTAAGRLCPEHLERFRHEPIDPVAVGVDEEGG